MSDNKDFGPYNIAFVDGGKVKHLPVPANSPKEAREKAKKFSRENSLPAFVEETGIPAHEVVEFSSQSWKPDVDWTGKRKRRNIP